MATEYSMNRREFLGATMGGALAMAANAPVWQPGQVRHLLPTVSDNRLLLKASFSARQSAPLLRVGRQMVKGRQTDSAGFFWTFDASGLQPGETHTLALLDHRRRALCDAWEIKTFPAPDATVQQFRLLIYTCAGGDERNRNAQGTPRFRSLAQRGRLLDRALSLNPNAVIANGDHIYWDLQQTGAPPPVSNNPVAATGRFTRNLPVLGTANEEVLKRIGEAQIASLYGTRFRGVPVFFLQDDHDYFENDDANNRRVTFPPDHFMWQLSRATRRLYYPEFLPDAERPLGLPGASAVDTPPGTGESYGTLRFGRLAEILLYDCRRYLTLAGPNAVVVAPEAEDWLKARMADRRVAHVVNVPSLPPGWTAGKWGDWYPDILGKDGRLTDKVVKPYWPAGWASQHDRLLQAASAMPGRIPLFISGDLHALAEGRIHRAGATDLQANPVNVLLAGPISTGTSWPSEARGTRPTPSLHVTVEERLPCVEENGFTLLDFTPERITARMFRWSPAQTDAALDRLEPFHTVEYRRP